ncbi:MAG: MoxR family ATPase [Oscillospiraceae bacterium]|jgi:MoxR-like ATPase|nr:MoxR family ATPase [Oscillospiraceae bacterium]
MSQELTEMREYLQGIVKNVNRVIVGKREVVELALMTLLCGGHILVEDVPGVGKTSLASALSRSIRCSFRRIQFTPDIMPSDITGFSLYNQKTGDFEYRQGLIFSSLILADEINRASPKTQASLLEAMEENQVTVDGTTYKMAKPFMVMATQNPADFVGTYPLPEAQMDRFLMRVSIGYPDFAEERNILRRFKEEEPEIHPVARAEEIVALQHAVRRVHVDDSLYDYIIRIIESTRSHPEVALGVSPRGSLALFHTAQARALYLGRDFVTPDDIKPLAEPVLAHRLVLRPEARLRRVTSGGVLKEILDLTPVPVGTPDR